MTEIAQRAQELYGYAKIVVLIIMLTLVTNVNQSLSNSIPVPDVKAYGSDGPVTKTVNDPLSIIVSLESAGLTSDADWWIAVQTPFDWFYLNAYAGSWLPGVSFTYQGPLLSLTPVEILNMSGLPAGTYRFYFGIDMNSNGQLDPGQLHYDELVVDVSAGGSSLAGTWLAMNIDSYVSLILTEPDRFSMTNYTWVNRCTESGNCTTSGSSITFALYSTNCEEGQGLVVGATTNVSCHMTMNQPSTSYNYSQIGKALSIQKIKMGGQTLDLVMDRMDTSKLKKIGNGIISVIRQDNYGTWAQTVDGDIPFTIFRLPFGDNVHHNEVYGYGDLRGELGVTTYGTSGKACDIMYEATGLAEIRGYFYEAPAGGSCMLGVALTDNYTWRECSIKELTGSCEGLNIGDRYENCMNPDPDWLEFPLNIGHVIRKGGGPNWREYILTDIKLGTEVLCPVYAE